MVKNYSLACNNANSINRNPFLLISFIYKECIDILLMNTRRKIKHWADKQEYGRDITTWRLAILVQ